jgi:imidazolonepropionase-like amidohydrolase
VKDAGIYVTPTNYFFFSSFADSISKGDYMKRPDYSYIPKIILDERWAIRARYWKAAPPQASRQKYIDLRKKMTCQLWKAGVPLMAGSDSPEWFLVQGFSIHDELETFVKAGLSNYAALETATKNPATYLGLIKSKGTVEVGKDADLVILDADPLSDIRNTRAISTVFVNGSPISYPELQKMLSDAKAVLAGN